MILEIIIFGTGFFGFMIICLCLWFLFEAIFLDDYLSERRGKKSRSEWLNEKVLK